MIQFSFGLISFFALIFLVVFAFVAKSIFMGHRRISQHVDEVFRQARQQPGSGDAGGSTSVGATPSKPESFGCSHCGASLDGDTEISPSGDFKCQYCDSWSNVNR